MRQFVPKIKRSQLGYLGIGNRRALGNARNFDVPSLNLDYVNRPGFFNGESLTRATAATYTDQDVIVRTALAGMARMQGMRVVRNLIVGNSEDLTNGGWGNSSGGTGTGPTTTFIAGIRPDGTSGFVSRVQLSCGAGTTAADVSTRFNSFTATFCVGSFWIKSNTGSSQKCSIILASTRADITATTSWQRFSLFQTSSGTKVQVAQFGNWKDANTADILVCQVQAEDVTGQTNTNPGECVSVGVLSTPFHGAGVDGVRYFTTTNGNTVASNVVTEATGAVISSAIRQGFLVEAAATNLLLQSQTFDNASWTKTNATVVANQAVAPDSTTTADLLYPTTTGTLRYLGNAVGVVNSATNYTDSIYAKAAGLNFLCLLDFAGVNACWFNLATGAVGTNNTTLTPRIVSMGNGWYRCSLSGTSVASAFLYALVCDADGSTTATTSGTNGIYLWGAQNELGSVATSYIPTTTAAVTRNASVATEATSLFPFNSAAGTIFAQYIQPVNDGLTHTVVCVDDGTANNRILIYTSAGTTYALITVGGVDKFSASIASPAVGTTVKVAMGYVVNGGYAYQNGVAMTIGTAGTTLPTVTTWRVGNAAGVNQLGAPIKAERYYNYLLPSGRAQNMTV